MRHVADQCAHLLQVCAAQNRDGSAGWLSESGDGAQQGRLSRTVIADDNVKPARRKLAGHAAQCGKAAELLHDVFCEDYRLLLRLGHMRKASFIAPLTVQVTAQKLCGTAIKAQGRVTLFEPAHAMKASKLVAWIELFLVLGYDQCFASNG